MAKQEFFDFLETVRLCQAPVAAHLHQKELEDDDVVRLAKDIKGNNALRIIRLNSNPFGDRGAKSLAESLKGSPTLKELYVHNTNIGPNGVVALAGSLDGMSLLNLSSIPVGEDGIRALADALATNETLETLTISSAGLGDTGATILAEGLARNRTLKHITLSGNGIGDAGAVALAKALRSHEGLYEFTIHDNKEIGKAGALALVGSLSQNRNLVKFKMGYIQDAAVREEVMQTYESAINGSNHKNIATNCLGSVNNPVHYKQVRDNQAFAAALKLRYLRPMTSDFSHIPVSALQEIRERENSIRENGGSESYKIVDAVMAYMHTLPTVEPEAITSPEELFNTDDNGKTPLDNPLVWEKMPAISRRLVGLGEPLTLEHLQREKYHGQSFFDLAPKRFLIPALNEAGIQVRKSFLLDDQNQPTPFFEEMIKDKATDYLFTHKNWRGAHQQELKAVIKAVPESQRPANRHTLFATLRSTAEHGRAG